MAGRAELHPEVALGHDDRVVARAVRVVIAGGDLDA